MTVLIVLGECRRWGLYMYSNIQKLCMELIGMEKIENTENGRELAHDTVLDWTDGETLILIEVWKLQSFLHSFFFVEVHFPVYQTNKYVWHGVWKYWIVTQMPRLVPCGQV